MTISRVCAVELPEDFNVSTYDHVSDRVALLTSRDDKKVRSKSAYPTFGSAWLGVGYRIAATVHYDGEFRAAMAAGGSDPSGVERFNQERALFGCATSAVSSIDCFFMASYAVGAAVPAPSFPLDDAKELHKYPPQVASAFAKDFPSDPFTPLAMSATVAAEFQDLKDVRDVLSHRGALLRSHFVGGGRPPYAALARNPRALAEDVRYSALLNDDTTRLHAKWTMRTLNRLVSALDAFVARQ